ncbi:MAG: hypothetical protein Q9221_008063 [Calogaya cf. arnoldii]
MMHILRTALRVLVILSVNNAIANAIPALPAGPIESTALETLQPWRPTDNDFPPGPLTVPSIPEFRVEYRTRRDQKLHQVEMYCNSIFAMIFLTKLGWDSPLLFRQFQMTTPWYRSELLGLAEIEPGTLKNKHLIMTIYDLSFYFAPRNLFNYQSALGSIQGRPAIRVTLQLKTPSLELDSSPDTIAPNTTTGAISAQPPSNKTLLSNDVPGKFIDPDDPKFVIRYERQPPGSGIIYVASLFTTFTEALVDLAPHPATELGACVNSVGYDRSTRLVILPAGTAERPLLSYGRCVQALGQLWRGLIELHEGLRTMRFDIEYAGVKLGSGFMKAVVPGVEDA